MLKNGKSVKLYGMYILPQLKKNAMETVNSKVNAAKTKTKQLKLVND